MIKNFVADEYVKDIFQIDLKKLKAEGKKVLFIDLDNTLVGASTKLPTPEIITFLNDASELGFKIMIASNNSKGRVAYFAKDLAITAHHRALKPLKLKMGRLLKEYDKSTAVMIGDQLLTDILVAKRLGIYAILVEPVELASDETSTKFNRRLERWLIKKLKKRNLPIPSYLDK